MDRNLSSSQLKIQNSVNIKSWVFGAISAFVISFIAINFLPKDSFLRISSLIAFTGVALVPAKKIIYHFLSADSRCKSCNTEFAVQRVDSKKEFISAIPRKNIKNMGNVGGHGPDVGKQIILHESWTEERYNITDTFACVECGDTHTTSRVTTQRSGYTSTKVRK
ncbi:TPA: hypothetical protein I4G69_003156 [Enterobacter asburiae]|nr:hypothetical protein [Enterobacter asburiae]